MIKLGSQIVGDGHPCYIVAEAGNNHNGDLKIAKKLIEKAAKSGANAIKFQTIIPEEFFSKVLDPKSYEYAKNISLNKKEHIILKNYAKKFNIDFFSTSFGIKSLNLLKNIKIDMIKIPSSDLNNFQLLKEASKTKLPLIVSTGMSSLSEISSVVEFLNKNKSKFSLLHCISVYPTLKQDTNLRTISFLKNTFKIPIGYSDHTVGIDACLIATCLGANIIEKHFTFDKNTEVPDKIISSDPIEFKTLVSKIRDFEKMIGTNRISIIKSEEKYKKIMRKSIGASTDIPSNTKIKKSMLKIFRPGNGIPPTHMENIIGLTTKKDIKKDTFISWDMF